MPSISFLVVRYFYDAIVWLPGPSLKVNQKKKLLGKDPSFTAHRFSPVTTDISISWRRWCKVLRKWYLRPTNIVHLQPCKSDCRRNSQEDVFFTKMSSVFYFLGRKKSKKSSESSATSWSLLWNWARWILQLRVLRRFRGTRCESSISVLDLDLRKTCPKTWCMKSHIYSDIYIHAYNMIGCTYVI